jgi:GT2 family glycosyltransferase
MEIGTLAISMVVATDNRAISLSTMLDSLCNVGPLPRELIVVDASSDAPATRNMLSAWQVRIQNNCAVHWQEARAAGAAVQRNQGVALATQPAVWFVDDDVIFETDCATRLFDALKCDSRVGGVSAMIANQSYHPPGLLSRQLFTLLHGHGETSFAGKVIGPAVNLLPEDNDNGPEIVPVEWLNTTCTMYRREALPDPPFPPNFFGYSLMEDVALSLEVGKLWKLVNARTARIFHDSQPGEHKSNDAVLSCMELVNRHFVMTQVMGKRRFTDYLKLAVWESFSITSLAANKSSRKKLASTLAGKFQGLRQIFRRLK